jgi:hypothetical protein
MTVPDTFFDPHVLESLTLEEFRAREPFPWHSFDGLLTDDAFARLRADFPRRDLFEWREGLQGQHYTRPHDRWFLEYRPDEPSAPGSARLSDLPDVWQRFLGELQGNTHYRELVTEWLGLDEYELRLTWHLGVTGSEVSPHLDTDKKIGTHIYYFNSADDWDPAWGGNLLVLKNDANGRKDPDFSDLTQEAEVDTLGNRSFLFKNSPRSLHGVRRLECPSGRYRRLFNVCYEHPPRQPQHASLAKRLHKRLAKQLHR